MKKLSNKRIRQKLKNPEEELQHNSYKKDTDSWDICDYAFVMSWERYWKYAVESWIRFDEPHGIPFPNRKKEFARWRKWYLSK